jgi:hypothetical protein
MTGVGRVHRRQEGERPLLGIAVAFVVDVVEDQPVEAERLEPAGGDVGDLPRLLRRGPRPRRGQREEQELAPA